ncbi:MAG: hypothetical protein ABI885_28280 [Gammaproteobacteria bacterium]
MNKNAALLAVALSVAATHASSLMAADAQATRVSVAPKGHYATLDALPDWGGTWFLTSAPGARPTPPKLKGPYKVAHEKWRAAAKANDGVVATSQSNCMPPGMPAIMGVAQYPLEFFFTPGRVIVHHEAWMQWRNIYTDGRKHPDDLDPTFQGDSIGHWEGDTLFVETVGTKENLGLTSSTRGPVPAHSPQLHILERIHFDPKNPNLLIDEIRLEDPQALEEPYQHTLTYRRDRDQALMEFVCAENERNPIDAQGNTTFKHE